MCSTKLKLRKETLLLPAKNSLQNQISLLIKNSPNQNKETPRASISCKTIELFRGVIFQGTLWGLITHLELAKISKTPFQSIKCMKRKRKWSIIQDIHLQLRDLPSISSTLTYCWTTKQSVWNFSCPIAKSSADQKSILTPIQPFMDQATKSNRIIKQSLEIITSSHQGIIAKKIS